MLRTLILFLSLMLLLMACSPQVTTTPTPVEISKLLATVEVSPTANPEQLSATRSVISPTPVPPTATVIPTETPYVGIFIGEAEQQEVMVNFDAPIIGPRVDLSQPTTNPQRCVNIPIDAPYETAWRTNATVSQRMGCPIQSGFGFFGEVQVFETGLMYYYPDFDAVWAIRPQADDGTGVYDYLENPTESPTIGIQPPQGLLVPGSTFGDMWIAVDGLREEMGFARAESQPTAMGLQRFENGTFLLDTPAGQVYALITDGTVLGPFLTSEIEPGVIATTTPLDETPQAQEGGLNVDIIAPETTPDVEIDLGTE